MAHMSFERIGIILKDWGIDDKEDCYSTIKKLSRDDQAFCFLAAAVDQLMIANRNLDTLRLLQSGKSDQCCIVHPVSDGVFHFLRGTFGEKLISEQLEAHYVSARARRILEKSGFKFCSEVTRANLRKIKYCGETTISELEDWAVEP